MKNAPLIVAFAFVGLVGCAGMASKTGKMRQFVNPQVDPTGIHRVTVIAGGGSKSNLQIMARARERITKAGIPVIKRSGEWDSDVAAVKDICLQTAGADNVDGVVITAWDRLTLHACPAGEVALDIAGTYAGIDAMVDRLLQYMGGSSKVK